MTFTILGFCASSGKVGYCQATSTPAVGGRCAEVIPGRGVLTVQAHADYRQLQRAKHLFASGLAPEQVVSKLRQEDPFFDYRQIAILDLEGRTAVHTGAKARPWAGERVAADHIVTGNVIIGDEVLQAMTKAFSASATEALEERLLRAIEAGRNAGGQEEGQTSSAMVVYERHTFPIVNLRIDVSLEPIAELRKVFNWYKPLIPYYVGRTLDPTSVEPKKAFLEKAGLPVNPYAA